MSSSHIVQVEKLYTVRPRSMITSDELSTSRGQSGYMKLINYSKDKHKLTGAPEKRGLKYLTNDTNGSKDTSFFKGFQPFLIQGVTFSLDEKVQVTPTFGDGHVAYYFGNNPISMRIDGVTLDDIDNSWFLDFISTYAEVMRGTRLAQAYELIELRLPNMFVVGTIQGLNFSQRAENDTLIQFSMNMLVKTISPVIPTFSYGELDPDQDMIDFEGYGTGTAINSADLSFYNPNQILKIKQASMPDYTGIMGGTIFWKNGRGGNVTTNSDSWLQSHLFTPVYGIIKDLRSMIKDFFKDLTDAITDFLSPITDFLDTVQNIENSVSGIISEVKGAIDDVFTGISNAFGAIGSVVSRAQSLFGGGSSSLSVKRFFKGQVNSFVEDISSKLRRMGLLGKFNIDRLLGINNPYTLPYKKALLSKAPIAPTSIIPLVVQIPPLPGLPATGITLQKGRGVTPTIPITVPA